MQCFTADPGDPRVIANPMVQTVLASAPPTGSLALWVDGDMRLVHRSPGWRSAGSAAVLVPHDMWGVVWERKEGTSHGRWFNDEASARALFNEKTQEAKQ